MPDDAVYDVEVLAWADQTGDEPAELSVLIESDTESSVGAAAIRKKLVELHERLLGVEVDDASPEIHIAYDLFVNVWGRKQNSADVNFFQEYGCDFSQDTEYLDGILEGAILDDGGWDYDHVQEFVDNADTGDPRGVARTWVVVLAYLLMDYRYLYL